MAIAVVMSSDKSSKNILKSGWHRLLFSPSVSTWGVPSQSAPDMGNGTRILNKIVDICRIVPVLDCAKSSLTSVYNPAQQYRHVMCQQKIFADVCRKVETGQEAGNTYDRLPMVSGC